MDTNNDEATQAILDLLDDQAYIGTYYYIEEGYDE